MPTRNINLTEHFDRFVERQVEAGRFRHASEMLRAGLHLLELQTREDEQKLALLRALAAEGIEQLDQGRGLAVKDERELANVIARLGRRSVGPAKRNVRRG